MSAEITSRASISVVVPMYGCAPCVSELCERLERTLEALTPAYEIILVDDRSPDGGWALMGQEAARNPRVRAVRLSRNFGQHAAIAAGLTIARGDWMVVMDCDLQDPPEAIADLHAKAAAGAEIVFARRDTRAAAGWRTLASRAYFALLNAVSDHRVDGSLGALTMFSRRVRDAYLAMTEHDRHHVMVLQWLGFEHAVIAYRQEPRRRGRSAYRLSTLIDSAITGLFFSSARLLRYVLYAGFTCALAGFALGILLTIRRLMAYTAPGWTGLIVAQLMIGGLTIMCVGAVGMYVGRVFDQVRGRPLFIIEEDSSSAASPRAGAPRA